MKIIFSGKVFSLYAQVALFDAEKSDSYPQWETGTESVIFGPRGIAVATLPDSHISVIVSEGGKREKGVLCFSGEFEVGCRGLLVGNVPSGNMTNIVWPAGKTSVAVYVDKLNTASQVQFVLQS